MAAYLKDVDDDGEHGFFFHGRVFRTRIEKGFWKNFESRPERHRQLIANQISYMWDELIEEFAKHGMQGTQYFVTEPGIENLELILRLMAKEPRTTRRMLARALVGIIEAGTQHPAQHGISRIQRDQTTSSWLFKSRALRLMKIID